MKKLLIILFLLVFGQIYAQQNKGQPALVSLGDVVNGEIAPTGNYLGTVQFYSVAKLSAERPGKVDSILKEEGIPVKTGTQLLQIDVSILKHNIEASSAKVKQNKFSLDKATRDYERAKKMYKADATSQQKFEDAETAYNVQANAYNIVFAELSILNEELKRSTIVAPYDGIILKRYVNKGDWVGTGAPLFDFAAKRQEVLVNVSKQTAVNLSVGQSIDIVCDDCEMKGKIRTIIPQGNTSNRTFPVKIDIPYNPALMSGMDVKVTLPVGKKQKALLVTRDAVVERNGKTMVFTVEDNKAKAVPVTVIGYDGIYAGITGQASFNKVIIRGNDRLTDGQPITIAGQAKDSNKEANKGK